MPDLKETNTLTDHETIKILLDYVKSLNKRVNELESFKRWQQETAHSMLETYPDRYPGDERFKQIYHSRMREKGERGEIKRGDRG